MSLRHSTPEMIAENLPRKGAARIDTTGLRKRVQFEQILNYLTYGQENIVYPDREAKLVRNHPFMTQLDFFDMQEDQKKPMGRTEKTTRGRGDCRKVWYVSRIRSSNGDTNR